MLIDKYFETLHAQLTQIQETQQDKISDIAVKIADSIEAGGIMHVFGSGHSHMIAEDVFHRAGGLACVNAMLEPSLMELNVGRATLLERLSGYADVLLTGYSLQPGEVIVVVSNSGINAVPIEVALACKKLGMFVVALTNMEHSLQTASRHESGKKLYEVADIVLDNCGVHGDAALSFDDNGNKTGATSTIGGIAIIQALTVAIVDELCRRDVSPPVLISANRDGGDGHNRELIDRYRNRIRYL
ncbi:SIS domain-containing protein [Paenibacillus roseipurpureus]|uniref:SIS domain-containing protein n=1 Tax=Paenibacillus roseopurpureus TaxID=2918901 RepID=A0AA96LJ89_9BACL|nr:SIS domain-containing protein [Paenibacillus sp. MBLB1832]WNR42720.1 SIS domain-containing protein [Paenibacillus sp. MBLB1832]